MASAALLELGRRTIQCTLEKCHGPEDDECPGDAPFVPLLAERRKALFDEGSSSLAVSLRNGDAPQHEECEGGTRIIAQFPVQGETFFEQRVAPPNLSLEISEPPGTDQSTLARVAVVSLGRSSARCSHMRASLWCSRTYQK